MKKNHLFIASCLIMISAKALAIDNDAQNSIGFLIEEVIVTAQKRQENLQEVPVAVSVFDKETLQVKGIDNLAGLNALAPNVIIKPIGLFPQSATFSIRGLSYFDIASEKDPTVGVVLDGVNLSRNLGTLIDMHDIERIEVLRGPQGTLFGRNNIGGVLNVVTIKPSDKFGGNVKFTAGNFGRLGIRGAVNMPLVNKPLSTKLAFISRRYDGHFKNSDNGKDFGEEEVQSFRATVRYTPSAPFDSTLILDDTRERNQGNGVTNFSRPTMNMAMIGFPADSDGNPYKIRSNIEPSADLDTTGVTLDANWQFKHGTLTSTTGWREMDDSTATDFDGEAETLFEVFREQEHELFTQELRYATNSGGSFNYVTGLYYSRQDFDLQNNQDIFLPLFGATPSTVIRSRSLAGQESYSFALFFQADIEIEERWTFTIGSRNTWEEKKFENDFFPQGLDENWTNFSAKLGADYQLSDNTLLYAGWSQGFRSGVFNARAGSASSVGPADEETVDSFEFGLKSDLLAQRLRLNAAAFHSIYDDMQLTNQRQAPGTNTFETVTTNVGKAIIQGLELEMTALLSEELTVQLVAGYLDTAFDEFDADLNGDGSVTDNSFFNLPFAPRWTYDISATYEIPAAYGTFTFHASWNYSDEYLTTNLKTDKLFFRDSVGEFNASISFEDSDERFQLALIGRNLNDQEEILSVFNVGGTFFDAGSYGPPRTWWIEGQYQF